MSELNKNCQACGKPLEPGAHFCEECGQPVEEDEAVVSPPAGQPPPSYIPPSPAYKPPPPVYTPPPPPSRTPATEPQKKRGSSCWIIGLIALAGFICLGVIVASAIWLVPELTSSLDPTPVGQDVPVEPNATPQSEQPGNAYKDEYSLYDDFSSKTLGWPESSGTETERGYENGTYFMHIKEPNYHLWSSVQSDFVPTTAEFDAVIPSGSRDGVYGVFCFYQDPGNFFWVKIDPFEHSYSIGRYINDFATVLTDPEWKSATLLGEVSQINHIAVECLPGGITLHVNNELVEYIYLSEEPPSGGLGLYAYGWAYLSPPGFKVLFDNFNAWEQIQ